MELSSSALQASLSKLFTRYHVIIYVVIVAGSLAAVVLTFYNIVSTSEQGSDLSTSSASQFDKETIERINQLKDRDQNKGTIDLSSGRTNPFVE